MKIAVSACLLGHNCKYNGGNNRHAGLLAALEGHEVIPVCPETAGKLPRPRPPAENVGDRVIDREGKDVTAAFHDGARVELARCIEADIELAILQPRSPSCGVDRIYDGTFTGTTIPGDGIFVRMLRQAGIAAATPEAFLAIDRDRVSQAFRDYVAEFDADDPKIALKAQHTLRVAELCDQLARSLGADEVDADVAWLVGMLHDIGRFEQVRRYGTFYDSQSVNHAEFGADLLFCDGLIGRFVDACPAGVETAIRNHNRLRVEEGLPPYIATLCDVIRDADKIDILRVNVERPAQEIYGAALPEIMAGDISPEVERAFDERHCVDRACMRSLIDRRVGHFCFAFELVYPWSRAELMRQGYLQQAMSVTSPNPATEATLVRMHGEMGEWLAEC